MITINDQVNIKLPLLSVNQVTNQSIKQQTTLHILASLEIKY